MLLNTTNKKYGINSFSLKILAMFFMLLDHIWGTQRNIPLAFTCIGRLAFPIFAFQLVVGYFHTKDYKKYLKRLLLFGLISELPFNYMISGSWFYPFHQNVMFTLALGLMLIKGLDSDTLPMPKRCLLIISSVILSVFGMPDYGLHGLMLISVFYFAAKTGKHYKYIIELIGMVAINIYMAEGMLIPIGNINFPVQGFAVFSLIFIWLYNGEKGRSGQFAQMAVYWFYPVHMLVLYLFAILR